MVAELARQKSGPLELRDLKRLDHETIAAVEQVVGMNIAQLIKEVNAVLAEPEQGDINVLSGPVI